MEAPSGQAASYALHRTCPRGCERGGRLSCPSRRQAGGQHFLVGLQSQRKGETSPLATSPCGGPEGSLSQASLSLPFNLGRKCARPGCQAEGPGHLPLLVSDAPALESQTSPLPSLRPHPPPPPASGLGRPGRQVCTISPGLKVSLFLDFGSNSSLLTHFSLCIFWTTVKFKDNF